MFTGLVETQGRLDQVVPEGANRRFRVSAPALLDGMRVGDSVAHDGVCLTVERILPEGYEAVAVAETLSVSTLGGRKVGDCLNLERALLPTSRMGGHWVQGHVDGIAKVVRRTPRQGSTEWHLRIPRHLARYCIARGSIALDGISLTLSEVDGDRIAVNVIPHTAQETGIRAWKVGREVNVEVDLLAKYVERILAARP